MKSWTKLLQNPLPSHLLGLAIILVCPAGQAQWTTLTVDNAGGLADVGRSTSQAIVNGNPAISYYDFTNFDLKYVRATNASGTAWGTPVAVATAGSVGVYASLAVVNGNPAIAYYANNPNLDLMYVRATDADGTAWGTPVAVDTPNNVGLWPSLVVVSGNPAISYHDLTNRDLRYVRATDADGTAWGAPVLVETAFNTGYETSMAVVAGNPAISYYRATNGDLKYVRATDAAGTAWDTPVNVDTVGSVGEFNSLKVVNGNPAISYSDGTNGDLKYVRATDGAGASWGTPLALDTTGSIGDWTSLAIVGGRPAISYYAGALRYIGATDADGTAWGTPVDADPTTNLGQYSSLLEVNGSPAISYYDNINHALNYAYFIPPTPTPSSSPTDSPTASPTASPTPSESPTPSPTASPTPTDIPVACFPDTLLQSIPNPTPVANDLFGASVAVSGNVAVIGAYLNDAGSTNAGTAYVFDATTGATGVTLSNPAPAINDSFGGSVAISGNVVVIGAHGDNFGANDSGTAYVFDATTGALTATLDNPTPAADDYFGYSVAVSGNVVVVGAYNDDSGATDSGAAYVFDATTGALVVTLNNPAPGVGDFFGHSVAISGNVAVVGAYGDDTGATDSGQAYVFDATTGALVATLNNPVPAAGDKFGFSVAVSGNVAVAGAPGRLSETGAAYSFNAATGALLAILNNPTPNTSESFGGSVAVSGGVVVVGSFRDDDPGVIDAGSAGVFSATSGVLAATLNNPAPAANDEFGGSVAVSGTVIVIGAHTNDTGAFNAGSAYTFSCIPPSPSPTATPSPTPTGSATATPTASPSASPTASQTPSPTLSPSPAPNAAARWELYE